MRLRNIPENVIDSRPTKGQRLVDQVSDKVESELKQVRITAVTTHLTLMGNPADWITETPIIDPAFMLLSKEEAAGELMQAINSFNEKSRAVIVKYHDEVQNAWAKSLK